MSADPATPIRIDVWSDVACPWCLLGNAHLAKAVEQTGIAVDITMRSYQLAPHIKAPQPVQAYLVEKFGSPTRVAEAQRRLTEMGEAAGLCYAFDTAVAANTFDAHRLHHLGIDKGVGAEVMDHLLRAQHTAGEDVSDHSVLRRIGHAAGLDAEDVDAMLASDAYADAVRADIDEARTIGVQGVPFFVFDRAFALSGAQPVSVFQEALAKAREAR